MTDKPGLIILDRDGVINEDSDNYIKSVEEWIPISGSIEAIALLSNAGFRIAVATNQSGLGRGLFELDDLEAMHEKLCTLVEEAEGHIDGIFYCPHTPDENCSCRKPATGLLDAIEDELGLPVKEAWFVGDAMRDLIAAVDKQCVPVLVKTGKGKKTLRELESSDKDLLTKTRVFQDLMDFARFATA